MSDTRTTVRGGGGPRVAVIGAGGFGAAIAWHLASLGMAVTVLERHDAVSQTAPRAAGLTMLTLGDQLAFDLQNRSIELIERFGDDVGPGLQAIRSGSLHLALTEATATQLGRSVASATSWGAGIESVDPGSIRERWRLIGADGVIAASFSPRDVYFEPGSLPRAYLAAAARLGATVRTRSPVLSMARSSAGIRLTVPDGHVDAEVVVDAAGAWVAVLAALGGASVPVVPVRHQLLITDPVAGYDDHPIVRILDHNLYTRPCDGGVLVGGYEAAPLVIDDVPDSVERLELDPTVPAELMRLAERWVVPLRGATVALTRGGIPTMTADGRPMFGWIPEMPGLLVVGGCNVGGLSISPAIGEITAGLVRGEPPTIDVRALDPMRHRDLGPTVVRREAVARYANRYHDEAGQPVVPNS